MENFQSAYAQANLLYGIELAPEEFEEIGLIAWNKIGNRQTKLYRYRCKIDCETLTVTLPCNCDFIEAVTYDFEDWRYTTNDTVNGDYQSQFIENYIEGRKVYSWVVLPGTAPAETTRDCTAHPLLNKYAVPPPEPAPIRPE